MQSSSCSLIVIMYQKLVLESQSAGLLTWSWTKLRGVPSREEKKRKKKVEAVSNLCLHTVPTSALFAAQVWCSTLAVAFHWWQQRTDVNAEGLLLISTQTALIFWCHQDWKRWLALASEVLKHPVVPGVMVVRVWVVVVGEDRVGVRPFWVTPCHVIGLLLKAQQASQLQDHASKIMCNVICDYT